MSLPDPASDLPDAPHLHASFLERLAHELRGPAGVTSGALDEIELAVDADSEDLRALFVMARRGMRRVLRLAERLQRTAQLERGDVEWALTTIDLRPLVELASRDAELLAARRAVRVSFSCSAEPCPGAVDAAWIQFAIAELVGNAIRFARSAVSVHCAAAGEELTIAITDDGPGFPPPGGERAEAPSARPGVGLTLPLVRDVIAAHRGRLDLDGPRDVEASGASGAVVVVTVPRSTLS